MPLLHSEMCERWICFHLAVDFGWTYLLQNQGDNA